MPPDKKIPFRTLEQWLQDNPDEHQRDPYGRFQSIPDHIQESIRDSAVVKGSEAQLVWQKISMYYKNRHDAQSIQYFARSGMFSHITALCEDRLNSLFVHRGQLMYGAFYDEKHVDVPRKSLFLLHADDIDARTHEALYLYTRFRNPTIHQAHYHELLMSDEVLDAYTDLYEVLKRLRNRQRTMIGNETTRFALDKPQELQQFWAMMQSGDWYSRTAMHESIGGGMRDVMPFRHGVPMYAIINQSSHLVHRIQLTHLAYAHVWRKIVQSTQQRAWQIPVLLQNPQGQVRWHTWATPKITIDKQYLTIDLS